MAPEEIKLYAPANAKNLTQEELARMETFTKADLKELAEAYPNVSNAYLIMRDKTKADNKQTFPLSTWKNMFELYKIGQTQFVAHSFRNIFVKQKASLKTAPVQDITKDQALKAIKTAPVQSVTSKENGGTKAEEKPLKKMNIPELQEKFLAVVGTAPEEGMTKANMIKGIEEKIAAGN